MNKQELINTVALKGEYTKKDAEKAIETIFGVIEDTVATGEKVKIIGHGTYEKKFVKGTSGKIQFGDRKGETWTTQDSYKPTFSAGSNFVNKVNVQ